MTGDGKSEAEGRRSIQVGANVCRSVEGVMGDRKISRKLNEKESSDAVCNTGRPLRY